MEGHPEQYLQLKCVRDHSFGSVSECECIGVLRHMQRYFSYTCDGTDVQAD